MQRQTSSSSYYNNDSTTSSLAGTSRSLLPSRQPKDDEELIMYGEEFNILRSTSDINARNAILDKILERSDMMNNTTSNPPTNQQQQQPLPQQLPPRTSSLNNSINGNVPIRQQYVPSSSSSTSNSNNSRLQPRPSGNQQQQLQAPPRRTSSQATSNRNTRGAPRGSIQFDVVTINMLNQIHYDKNCHAMHKMPFDVRQERITTYIKNVVSLFPKLGFICMQEVNFCDLKGPVFQQLQRNGFDFVFPFQRQHDNHHGKAGASVSLAELEMLNPRDVPNDTICIAFNAKYFKLTGDPRVHYFHPGRYGKLILSQLFVNDETNMLVKICTCHLPWEQDDANKKRYLALLNQHLPDPASQFNFILTGDFNIDDNKEPQMMKTNMVGSFNWQQATSTLKWTAQSPTKGTAKIDYVFFRGPQVSLISKDPSGADPVFCDPDNENTLLYHQGQEPIYPESFFSDHAAVCCSMQLVA